MVVLDVIATDAHGKPVRDLKQQELKIFEEHNNEQKLARFEFVDKQASLTSPPPAPTPPDSASYSNRMPFEHLTIAPTVLLLDGLNTETANQLYARKQMIGLLKTLPSNTPMAVFLLGNSLRMLQGFTTNPGLLSAALDKAHNPQYIDPYPADDQNSASNAMLGSVYAAVEGDSDPSFQVMVQQVQDFEKEQYANSIDSRVTITLAALTAIGQYLSGIPGRKNLIWVSQAFPISLMPDTETGTPFTGARDYSDKVEAAANTLADAQVAVYPVDASGLEVNQAFTASQNPITPTRHNSADRGMPAILKREQNTRFLTQAGTAELAKETGGEACANTNDLSRCVSTALADSSSYYEVGFYPENINLDGRFHKLVVKTSRAGVSLSYRRGYFALDVAAVASKQSSEDQLRNVCAQLVPPTGISLTARPASLDESGAAEGLGYLLFIAPSDVTIQQTNGAFKLNMQVGSCGYGANGDSYLFGEQAVTQQFPQETLQSWQSTGIPYLSQLRPDPNIRRIRFAVFDVPTGLAGAIDIPVRPQNGGEAPALAWQPAKFAMPPILEIPDTGFSTFSDQLTFKTSSEGTGSLTWRDDLSYEGGLATSQSAPAFLKYAFGGRFRCQNGKFLPVDPAIGEPKLQIIFRSGEGQMLTIDLAGSEPGYFGDLSVAASAEAFFDQVWKLSHCEPTSN